MRRYFILFGSLPMLSWLFFSLSVLLAFSISFLFSFFPFYLSVYIIYFFFSFIRNQKNCPFEAFHVQPLQLYLATDFFK
jgi:hypothetical protein